MKSLSFMSNCCFNCFKWFPVAFIIGVVSWSYYAYVIVLCISQINSNNVVKQVFYLILYHLILFCFLFSYFKTIFAKHNSIPSEFHISADDLIKLGTSNNDNESKEILDNLSKNLPLLTRSHNGLVRYCPICRVIKPDRAHHCTHCGQCVLKMDHHCPWVNNCVGHANYKFFLLFLFYAFVLCLFVAFTSLEYCIEFWGKGMSSMPTNGFQLMFLFIISIAFSFSVSMLLFYHLFLVSKNRSTLESYRSTIFQTFGPDKSGFDLGWRENIEQVFGKNKLLMFLPIFTSKNDGVYYESKRSNRQNHELLIDNSSIGNVSNSYTQRNNKVLGKNEQNGGGDSVIYILD